MCNANKGSPWNALERVTRGTDFAVDLEATTKSKNMSVWSKEGGYYHSRLRRVVEGLCEFLVLPWIVSGM